MYKIVLTPIQRKYVTHVEYANGNVSFTPVEGAASYKLYSKHFADDQWQYIGEIEPSGTHIDANAYTEIAIAVVFTDGYEQDPRDCVSFAPTKQHMNVVVPDKAGDVSSYGSRMLMGMPEVIKAKYNDMSNFGFSAHTFGKALDGTKQNMYVISLLKKFKPIQDTPGVAYSFGNIDVVGLPYGVRNNKQYVLEDITTQAIVLANGIEIDNDINTVDFGNVIGDISSTKIVDEYTKYYNIHGDEEDVVIYYNPTEATLSLYSSKTKDYIGTFTVVQNKVDILSGTTIIGVDSTPEYLYVAYASENTLNVAIVDKTIPIGSNALVAQKVLSTEMPNENILGMRTYTNVIVFQTATGYLAYRKMFNYFYVQDSAFYTFEDYSAVVSGQSTYHYNNYSNIWTDVDDMMQMFGRYRAQGENVSTFYFRMLHEIMHPVNATTPAMLSYMYYIADEKPYSTGIVLKPFNEHPYFRNMNNGIVSNALTRIMESNKTVWGLAEWGNVFKTNANSFANDVFYPKYDNADGEFVNGISYETPSGGRFIYSNNAAWYETPGKTIKMQQVSDGNVLDAVPADFEPFVSANNNVVFLRDKDALDRVITIHTTDSYDYLRIESNDAINVTVEYESTDGNVYTDAGTFANGEFQLSKRIKDDGYINITAVDTAGNNIDMYILRGNTTFAAYDHAQNSVRVYPNDKSITIEYVEE